MEPMPEANEATTSNPASAINMVEPKPFNRLDPKNRGVHISFFKPVYDEIGGTICRFEDYDGQPSYHETIVNEARKMLRRAQRNGTPCDPCFLLRLPLNIRFRIYAYLFTHDGSAIEIGRLKRTRVAKLAILRTSHTIYHEASIALYYSLCYRRLFLRTFGSYSADLLRRYPKPLRCCKRHTYFKWMGYSCRNHKISWQRSFGSILILLGSTDFRTALQRRWSFSEFITTLRMDEPLRVYDLTIVATENWKMPGFDEKDLIKALFSGAFEYLGKLNLKGFNEGERKRIYQLVHGLKNPCLRIERPKKKIKGPGFCIWICKCFLPRFSSK